MFFGVNFAGAPNSFGAYSEPVQQFDQIELKNSYVDEMYASTDLTADIDKPIPTGWDYNTIIHATFDENLSGGNITYATEIISAIKLKKKLLGDTVWKTIYSQEVKTNDDFEINIVDYLEPSNHTIEYMYVPVFNTGADVMDSSSNVSTIESKFDSYFIIGTNPDEIGHNISYPAIIDLKNENTYNRKQNVIESPGSKYPYVSSYGLTRYYSGNMTVTFIPFNSDCTLDVENGWNYRKQLDEFLANDRTKIIKTYEGDMYLIAVTSPITHSDDSWYQNISSTFSWSEIGNPYFVGDLYDNGYIVTDVDRRLDR